jgi:hypothetical protein
MQDHESQTEQSMVVLDQGTRLSKSVIFPLLEEYYANASLSAWDQVPFYPTSNAFIAEAYAEQIVAFLRDYQTRLNQDEPVYIIEMASGSGCFSFYILQELEKKKAYFSSLNAIKLRYVMTDFTERNVNVWEKSEKLKPFVESGILDFAVFRPDSDTSVQLRLSGTILGGKTMNNPLIAIANYFFDTIKHDAFQIKNGLLKEVRTSFCCPADKVPESGNPQFADFEKSETYHDTHFEGYYQDEVLNGVLEKYCQLFEFEDASILIPYGAFDCLKNLRAISSDNLVLLSSDKGYTDEESMRGCYAQPFVAHHGIFSYSVNYDAIRKYFELIGGVGFATTDNNLSVATTATFLLKEPAALEYSHWYFKEKFDKQNLGNYLYFMQELLCGEVPSTARKNEVLRACLGFIQLSNYCPVVFCLAASKILDTVKDSSSYVQQRLIEMMPKISEKFYSVQQRSDVFYWQGRIYYSLNMLDAALESFEESELVFGETGRSLYSLASCHEAMGNYLQASSYYYATLELEADCHYTQSGLYRVTSKLRGGVAELPEYPRLIA